MKKYFNSLSFKQKNKYLAVGAGAFAIIVYLFALSHTTEAYRKKTALTQKLSNAKSSPQEIAVFENKLAFINSKVNAFIIDSTRSQEQILDEVSTFCNANNLILKEFPKTSLEEQQDFTLETNNIVVEGSYKNLVQLIYELEHIHKVGKITSVSFSSLIDNKLKKSVLTVVIYLQNIRIKNKADEKS